MAVVENLSSKRLYRTELFILKIIPILLSLIALSNTVLSYFYIDVPLLSYLGGISILPLLFLYLSSYVFKFCVYHRMFLHYVFLNWVLNLVDYYLGIPVSNKGLFLFYMIMTGVFLFLILYFRRKCTKARCIERKKKGTS